MDGLMRPALFGLFLVSFTISKPIFQLDHPTLSSQSSESNESSSSEEISNPNPSVEPLELNTVTLDILEDHQNQTSPQPAQHLSAIPLIDVLNNSSSNSSVGSLYPEVTVDPGVQRVVFPDLSTPEPRCYTLPLTTALPKPARGDNI